MKLDSSVEEVFVRVGINLPQILGEYAGDFFAIEPSRFRHVAGTLIQSILLFEYAGGSDLKIAKNAELLKSYMSLISKFPHFRIEELKNSNDPSNPRRVSISGSMEDYIHTQMKELRGKPPVYDCVQQVI